MLKSCGTCKKDFLTEADPYGVIPFKTGYTLYCPTCFMEMMTSKLEPVQEALGWKTQQGLRR